MASLGNPRSWVPYMNSNNKDCSQGFCSLYCPQWCYIVFPPPPPPNLEFPQNHTNSISTPNFSPLVIAIIGILASAFLLVSYYTFISKYCGRNTESDNHHIPQDETHDNDQIQEASIFQEPWHVASNGLDEALIKSITVCKYKKAEGLVGVTDCSVCLSEFEEDESLRLLPKCNHAFHIFCIDQWLKSHSNCPLCRAHIFNTFTNASSSSSIIPLPPHPPPPLVQQEASSMETQNQSSEEDIVSRVESSDAEQGGKATLRAFSDLGFVQGRHRVIEIRDEDDEGEGGIRRTVSMDHWFQIEEDEEEAGTSKRPGRGESSKHGKRRKMLLRYVLSPMAMKRSFSSGRFSICRNGRGRQGINIIPL